MRVDFLSSAFHLVHQVPCTFWKNERKGKGVFQMPPPAFHPTTHRRETSHGMTAKRIRLT